MGFCGGLRADRAADKEKRRVESNTQNKYTYKSAAAVFKNAHKIFYQQRTEYRCNGEHSHCYRIEVLHVKIILERVDHHRTFYGHKRVCQKHTYEDNYAGTVLSDKPELSDQIALFGFFLALSFNDL